MTFTLEQETSLKGTARPLTEGTLWLYELDWTKEIHVLIYIWPGKGFVRYMCYDFNLRHWTKEIHVLYLTWKRICQIYFNLRHIARNLGRDLNLTKIVNVVVDVDFTSKFTCVDCILQKVVNTHINVDLHVDFVVIYEWNSSKEGIK